MGCGGGTLPYPLPNPILPYPTDSGAPQVLGNFRKRWLRPYMTEKLLTRRLNQNQPAQKTLPYPTPPYPTLPHPHGDIYLIHRLGYFLCIFYFILFLFLFGGGGVKTRFWGLAYEAAESRGYPPPYPTLEFEYYVG